MENKIAHIISKSISHNIKLLQEGYFDDMFDEKDDKDNGFLDDVLPDDQEKQTHGLLVKTLQDLSSVHITPLLLDAISGHKDKIELSDFIKHLPKEKYNKETHRYEIVYTAKTLITVRKWYLFLSSITQTNYNDLNNNWRTVKNMCSPIYINNPVGGFRIPRLPVESGPGALSMWFLDFNENTEKSDIYTYIKEHPHLYDGTNIKAIKSKYSKWLNNYKSYQTSSAFFNRLIKKSNLYENCYISPNKGIAITTQIQYAEPDDIIYTIDELKKQYMYIMHETGGLTQYYRKIQYIYTIQFTNDYDFKKELANLDD